MTGEVVKVETANIPEFRQRELAQCVLASLELALAQPGAEEEFQAWLKEYRRKKGGKSRQRKESLDVFQRMPRLWRTP